MEKGHNFGYQRRKKQSNRKKGQDRIYLAENWRKIGKIYKKQKVC